MQTVLIINTKSRQGKKLFPVVVKELNNRGITLAAAIPVRKPKILSNVLRREIEKGAKLVIIGGGDGTIRLVLDQFAYKPNLTLAVLPLGTGNGFARSLSIPLNLKGAIDVIVSGKTVRVDLGKADHLYFANTAAVGFSAKIARKTPPWLKKTYGMFAFAFVALKYLFSGKPFHYRITSPSYHKEGKTHQLIIANGSFIGGTLLTPEARLGNHQLLVIQFDTYKRWDILVHSLAFALGKPTIIPTTRYFQTEKLHLETTPIRYLDLDGQVMSQTPVTFSIAKNALQVRVPLSFQDPD